MKLTELLLKFDWNVTVVIRVQTNDGIDLVYSGTISDMPLEIILSLNKYDEYDCDFSVYEDYVTIILSKG